MDDIISTARTMIERVGHLRTLGMKTPICIGVHAVFAGDVYRELIGAGVERVITCSTVMHETNRIDRRHIKKRKHVSKPSGIRRATTRDRRWAMPNTTMMRPVHQLIRF